MERREFVANTTLTALSAGRALGANERVGLAVIGCGGRGNYVARFMLQAPGAEVVVELPGESFVLLTEVR